MENKKKNFIMISIIIGVLALTIGITYAAFNYIDGGENQQLVLGDIYMHYDETNQLVIENAMPSSTYDASKYFEFTVSGKNTYEKKDIYYEIKLTRGDNHETRTTRLDDKFLKFTLVEVVGETENVLFENETYGNLFNKRIWVDTIGADDNDYSKTFRLYTWISDEIIIGNTSDVDYDIDTWNNEVYASIKVDVYGDFEEKKLVQATDASCFDYEENYDGTLTITNYYLYGATSEYENSNCSENVVIPGQIDGKNVTVIGVDAFYYDDYEYLLKLKSIVIPDSVTTIEDSAFYSNDLTSVEIPNSVTTIGDYAFNDNNLTSVVIPDSVTTIGNSAFSYNDLTSVEISNSVTTIEDYAFSYNDLTSVEIPNSVTSIGNFAFSSNDLTSVEIPNSVTEIGENAFEYNYLKSVEIPNSVTTIGYFAFYQNDLKSVEIPNSVTTIGTCAFCKNDLRTVTIGNNIQYIGNSAFEVYSFDGDEYNLNLESITFTSKTCDEIKNIEGASWDTTKYFPWLSGYTEENYATPITKIIGTDGECSY